ncbi:NAD(P)-dependent oxidoreductase [uncultured Parasphingopyxis sp.]|uniref:precorrin-2 dehydrogenase/sirohydrochlorin ferrochelatase family protein n=1 Tax=uncultured Parasphingopyxis sp. TaxID=1547918 RepID=UPI00262CC0AC|nr:NAD(P)-dependent oxidoreductase [uncultured Parasphingopyxis sp.]
MHSLPAFLKIRGRPVIVLGAGDAADAKRVLVERAGGIPVDEADEEARLAIVAIDDEADALAAIDRLKTRGTLVNAVDRPDHCDFTMPAILDRDPVLVAIGTGGASAGLAKALRQRAERLIPAGIGAVATRMRELRGDLRARWPDAEARRHAIDAAFDEHGPLDPLLPRSAEDVDRWLAGQESAPPRTGDQFETIVLRSGDPDDLSIGETLLLGRADRVYLAPGVPEAIAHRARADAKRIETDTAPIDPGPGLSVHIKMAE